VGIEEAGTEILARKATRELLGFKEHKQAFSLPTKKVYGRYDGGDGSYNKYIGGLFTSVAKHTGDLGIHDRVENAFIATRKWGDGSTYSSGRHQIIDFVDNLTDSKGEKLSLDVREKLIEELASSSGPLANS
ncbi:MAG: hypothetical protein V4760_13215, partial [Bdellovibrionota bacterium]